jgi:hypothetical protein
MEVQVNLGKIERLHLKNKLKTKGLGHGSSDKALLKNKNKTRGGYHWVRGRHKERAKEGEYSGCSLYSCMKIE